VAVGSVPRRVVLACKQQTADENEAREININKNMQRARVHRRPQVFFIFFLKNRIFERRKHFFIFSLNYLISL
jgi:hypothetical protein